MLKNLNDSQLSSPEADGMPSKRQKLNCSPPDFASTDTGPLHDHQIASMEKELAALHIKLAQVSTIFNQFQKRKRQIEKILEEEGKDLEVELEVNKEMIKQTEICLATQIRSCQGSHGSQTSFDIEILQLKVRLNQRIKELLNESPRMIEPPSLEPPLSSPEAKLETAEKKIKIELEEMLKDNEHFLGFDHKEFEGTRLKLQKWISVRDFWEKKQMHPVDPGVDASVELDETIKMDASEIANLQQSGTVLSQKMEELQSAVDDLQKKNESYRQLYEELEDMTRNMARESAGDSEELMITTDDSPNLADVNLSAGAEDVFGQLLYESTTKNDAEDSQATQDERSDSGNDDQSAELSGVVGRSPSPPGSEQETTSVGDGDASQVDSSRQNLVINVNEHYVVPTNKKWFMIDWEQQYTQGANRIYVCNTCSVAMENQMRIQDHVWVDHFHGKFRCPFCPDSARSMTRRQSIGAHMRTKHHR